MEYSLKTHIYIYKQRFSYYLLLEALLLEVIWA